MKFQYKTLIYLLLILSSLIFPFSSAQAAFRVVTQGLPDGSTDGEYFAAIITANADGPVTFTANTLPPGLSLDSSTGFITGIPTVVDPTSDFDIDVDDGGAPISFVVQAKITATGGGGNAGIAITSTLVDGEVDTPYTDTIVVGAAGTPPFIYGVQNFPLGLTLNGGTGDITGTPEEAGTFFVIITVIDATNKKVTTTQPLLILPPSSTFQFSTRVMDNGEVGSAFSHFIEVMNETGAVAYSATGLPAGLTINPATGEITGMPTEPGTFEPRFTATDDNNTIQTNLRMWILSSDTSNFYWDYFGVPAALFGESYGIQPPLDVITQNGVDPVIYSVVGLPSGIDYDTSSGVLTGTTFEQGTFPVTYTAIDDDGNGETIILETVFVVLPPGGGDVNSIVVNLWLKKLVAKDDGSIDKWKAIYIYNADRSVGNAFDHNNDNFFASLNNSERALVAGSLKKNKFKQLVFNDIIKDPTAPGAKVKISPKNQTLKVIIKNQGLGLTFPATSVENNITLGNRSYALNIDLDEVPTAPNKGKYLRTFGANNTSFVVANGILRAEQTKFSVLKLKMFMANPAFNYTLADTIELRVFNGVDEIFYKDITDFVRIKEVKYKGQLVEKIKTPLVTGDSGDVDGNDKLKKFVYHPGSGLMKLKIKKPTITTQEMGNTAKDGVNLGVEMTIGNKSYFTTVTFFERATNGVYKTVMPDKLL